MRGLLSTPLLTSIASVLASYWIIENAAMFAVGIFYAFPLENLVFYSIAQTVFYCVLVAFLYLCRDFFYIEGSREKLQRVNLANKITLIRVSMVPSIFFLILAAREYAIAPILTGVLALTFVTDLIDGRVSRARNEVTRIGRILDSVSDYSLLLVIAIAYRIFDLLPAWLFLIIFFRLMFQALGMCFVLIVKKKVEPKPTLFGKIAIATTMSLFALETLKLLIPFSDFSFLAFIELFAGVVVSLSMFDKMHYFRSQIRKKPSRPDAEND